MFIPNRSQREKKGLVWIRVVSVAISYDDTDNIVRCKTPIFTNMLLIYSDLIWDDKDLCNILATLQLESRVASVATLQASACNHGTVAAQVAGNIQNETPACAHLPHRLLTLPVTCVWNWCYNAHWCITGSACLKELYSEKCLQCIVGWVDRNQGHMVHLTSPYVNAS